MSFQHVVKFVASWMNFEKHCKANPDPKVRQQSRVSELEKKLAERETIIEARSTELAEARKWRRGQENLVKEYEKTLSDTLEGSEMLKKEVERLSIELDSVQTKLAVSQVDLEALRAELITTHAEKREALIAKNTALNEKAELLPKETVLCPRGM